MFIEMTGDILEGMKRKQTKVSLPQMKDRLSERLHLGLPMVHFRT